MYRMQFAASVTIILGIVATLTPLIAQEVAPAVELGKSKVKLLQCQAYIGPHNCFMSPGGQWAMIYEGQPGEGQRLSLWDLEKGKLVRFLSAEKGKGTKDYAGDDDDDFGAKVEQPGSQAFTFSTDGKLAAANVNETVKIWELASGKLLHEVEGSRFHPHTFRFADERRIVGKSNGGVVIESIDAKTGEKRKLMGPVGYESYGGAVRGDTFTLVSPSDVYSLSLKTGARTRLAGLSPTSRMAPWRTWYSQDGAKLYIQREELVQVLDVATGKYTDEYQVVVPNQAHRVQALATEASLLAVCHPEKIELWDPVLGAVRTFVVSPSRHGDIGGISADGSKLLLAQDGPGAVVLAFGGPPPAGEINVPKLIAEQAPVATR